MASERARLTTEDLASRADDGHDGTPLPEHRDLERTAHAEVERGNPSEGPDDDPKQPLLDEQRAGAFRRRWEAVQTEFVDEPRRSVKQADQLVAEVMQHLAETFSRERKGLEGNWDRGDDVSTEDLRVALRRYRSFFDRLLAT